VAQTAARLKEAQKLGFTHAVVPEAARGEVSESGLSLTTVGMLVNLVSEIASRGDRARRIDRDRGMAAE
jgi:DNA repair protein RadA/Sms